MLRIAGRGLLVAVLFMLPGCGDRESSDEHVWEEQTRALERAREAEKDLLDATEKRHQEIDRHR